MCISDIPSNWNVQTQNEFIKENKRNPRWILHYVEYFNNDIDWDNIAATSSTGRDKNDVTACWNDKINPDINRDKFTPKEEKQLNKIANKYNGRNWDKIASELNVC